MCDYSLESVASRPARVGDKLVTNKFLSCTTGFVSSDDTSTAVCMIPGTEVGFEANIVTSPIWGVTRTLEYSVGVFTQVNKGQHFCHHDALEFPDGSSVLINELTSDQKASVLQLPAKHLPEMIEQLKKGVVEVVAVLSNN